MMKYLAAALTFTGCIVLTQAQAQTAEKHHQEITMAQQAEIRSKTLALHLDLNKKQQQMIMELEKDMFTKRKAIKEEARAQREDNRSTREGRNHHRPKPTRKHHLPPELHIKTLDLQLAHQEKMKKILSEDQYRQWIHMKHRKHRSAHRKHSKQHAKPGRR
ncbi:hypothetical protein [Robertkochia sediminum]|uniref:hypothetical protein n=1 Tax=Robertkochia sediminum TaxID=2785326 RepID=UPI001931E8B0|nr:hypothetical protein [Robertkochia sediminum]MBL7472881.1 hypothetical protein [Robertkochia sediminum]